MGTLKRFILSSKMPSCEEMMVILKYLDLDSDGFITEEEVKKTIIEKNGEDSPFVGEAGEFLALFGQFRDADGKVPLKEICGLRTNCGNYEDLHRYGRRVRK